MKKSANYSIQGGRSYFVAAEDYRGSQFAVRGQRSEDSAIQG
jgi:hypothetical protein